MIKALLLIVAPASTWERIARSRRSIPFIFFLYLLPTIALSMVIEILGHNYLVRFFTDPDVKPIPRELAIHWGVAELVAGLLVTVLFCLVVQLCARTFHNRNTATQCFTVAAFALGPFYLIHIFDAVPVLSQWITLGVGIALTLMTLYHAIPLVLKPDPPHAFGLFVMSCFVFIMLAGLARMALLLAVPARYQVH
jgi:Yip1 domain